MARSTGRNQVETPGSTSLVQVFIEKKTRGKVTRDQAGESTEWSTEQGISVLMAD